MLEFKRVDNYKFGITFLVVANLVVLCFNDYRSTFQTFRE